MYMKKILSYLIIITLLLINGYAPGPTGCSGYTLSQTIQGDGIVTELRLFEAINEFEKSCVELDYITNHTSSSYIRAYVIDNLGYRLASTGTTLSAGTNTGTRVLDDFKGGNVSIILYQDDDNAYYDLTNVSPIFEYNLIVGGLVQTFDPVQMRPYFLTEVNLNVVNDNFEYVTFNVDNLGTYGQLIKFVLEYEHVTHGVLEEFFQYNIQSNPNEQFKREIPIYDGDYNINVKLYNIITGELYNVSTTQYSRTGGLTYTPETQPQTQTSNIQTLNGVTSDVMGVTGTVISSTSNLMVNNIVPLIVVGAFVGFVVGIIILLRARIFSFFKN